MGLVIFPVGTGFLFILNVIYFCISLSDSDGSRWQKADLESGVIGGHDNKELLCWDAAFSLSGQQPAGHSLSEPFLIILIHFSDSIPPWKPEEEEIPNMWRRRRGEDRENSFNMNGAKSDFLYTFTVTSHYTKLSAFLKLLQKLSTLSGY